MVTGSSLYLLTHLAGLTFYFSDRSHYIALVGLKFMIILLNARMTGLDYHASSKFFKLLFYIASVYSQILLSLYFFLRFILFVFMVCVSTHRCQKRSSGVRELESQVWAGT